MSGVESIHLGEIMKESGITQSRLATTVGVPQVGSHNIVPCRRTITTDTALRTGRALRMTHERMTREFWLNLQRMYHPEEPWGLTDISAKSRWLRQPRETPPKPSHVG